MSRIQTWHYWLNKLGPFLALLLVYGLFAVVAPASFRGTGNLELMARQTAVVGTAAVGMTLVMIAAGIDLSVGSVVALTSMMIAVLLNENISPLWSALAGIGLATLCGLINGTIIIGHLGRVVSLMVGVATGLILYGMCSELPTMVAWVLGGLCGWAVGMLVLWINERFVGRIPVTPFIVTLGMMLVIRGCAKFLGDEQKVNAPRTWLKELLASLPSERHWMLLPAGVWILIVLAVSAAFLLYFTKLGRHILAIGSNERTARLCGVAVERVKVYVYSLCGTAAGLAGLMQFSRLNIGDPIAAVGMELDVIAAVVIGGGSLSGGEGSIFGTLVGALIMTVIRSGCTQLGLPNYTQEIITGIIIVHAVAIDHLRHRGKI